MIEHTTAGEGTIAELAAAHKCEVSTILRLTAEHSPGAIYPPDVAAWLNDVFAGKRPVTEKMPAGLRLYLPG